MVPETVEHAAGLGANGTESQQIEVMEIVGIAEAKIVIADIASTDDGRHTICHHELVVHTAVEAFHLHEKGSGTGKDAPLLPGIENAELDVGMILQLVHELPQANGEQVVHDEPHPYAPVCSFHHPLQQQGAGVVGVPEIGLYIQGGHSGIDEC